MPLFEYDQGHLIPAQFGHPVGAAAQGEVLKSVRRQVLEVISRPLFPVTWNDAISAIPGMPAEMTPHTSTTDPDYTSTPNSHQTPESPRLTALDGSGQVVLVEVMDKLDATSLMNALARLGAVSNLGWNELAAAYPGGVAAFRNGWTQFRDAMPPNLTAGPRLILVACEIDPSVRPALDALTPSGLEVHHVAVREMSNGRRFLDVQRVAASLFSHDTNILAGRGARVPAINAAAEDVASRAAAVPVPGEVVDAVPVQVGFPGEGGPAIPAEVAVATGQGDAPGEDGKGVPAEAPAEESTQQATPAQPAPTPQDLETAEHNLTRPEEVAPEEEPLLQTGSISRRSIMEALQASAVSPLAEKGDEEAVYTMFTPISGSGGTSDFAELIGADQQHHHGSHSVENPVEAAEGLSDAQGFESAESVDGARAAAVEETDGVDNSAGTNATYADVPRDDDGENANADSADLLADLPETPTRVSPHLHVPDDLDPVESGASDNRTEAADLETDADDIPGLLGRDRAGLAALSQVTGEETPLFGRVTLGEETADVQGTLGTDGRITVEGRVFEDPDLAAQSLGIDSDGWDFWHLGLSDGPTLDEARAEVNAEIRRGTK